MQSKGPSNLWENCERRQTLLLKAVCQPYGSTTVWNAADRATQHLGSSHVAEQKLGSKAESAEIY
jgi:hypothetical protein